MKNIFLDTNILFDIILERDKNSKIIIQGLKKIPPSKLYISSLSVHIIFYVLKIRYGSLEYDRIKNFLTKMNILPLSESITLEAISNEFFDFEDKLQYLCAIDKCDIIVTRDVKDFNRIKKTIPSNIVIVDSLEV